MPKNVFFETKTYPTITGTTFTTLLIILSDFIYFFEKKHLECNFLN